MSNAIAAIRQEANAMESQFMAALPAHIPVERFTRVVMTAIQGEPNLARCDRRSLWTSAMKAAQDGLLPDGRDGAIVPYKGQATWMVMIGGLRKKVRNSGEIATWDVQAVYENDEFDYQLGDTPRIFHKPTLEDPGKLIAVYSIATLKSGEVSRDVMSVSAVEKIRKKSRAQKGPWSDPTFYPEMAKKTVARRHSKVLPMSTDLDDLIRRDDDLYNLNAASDENVKTQSGLAEKMAALTAGDDEGAAEDQIENINPDTGEITDDADDQAAASETKSENKSSSEKNEAHGKAKRDAENQRRDDEMEAKKAEAKAKTDPDPEPEKSAKKTEEKAEEKPAAETKKENPADRTDPETYDEDQIKAHDIGAINRGKGMARDIVTNGYANDPRLLAAYQTGWDNEGN